MKNTTIKKITFIAAILVSITAYPQGYVNLNFENPILPLVPDINEVLIANATRRDCFGRSKPRCSNSASSKVPGIHPCGIFPSGEATSLTWPWPGKRKLTNHSW